jgi:hypothetical protein
MAGSEIYFERGNAASRAHIHPNVYTVVSMAADSTIPCHLSCCVLCLPTGSLCLDSLGRQRHTLKMR